LNSIHTKFVVDEIFIDRPIYIDDGIVKLTTPNDARLKNLTYETHIYANIVVNIYDDNENLIVKKFENVAIGSIPIMLHSDICLLNNQGSRVFFAKFFSYLFIEFFQRHNS
jgi:DNA-directed RNA polymerase beta subunit